MLWEFVELLRGKRKAACEVLGGEVGGIFAYKKKRGRISHKLRKGRWHKGSWGKRGDPRKKTKEEKMNPLGKKIWEHSERKRDSKKRMNQKGHKQQTAKIRKGKGKISKKKTPVLERSSR